MKAVDVAVVGAGPAGLAAAAVTGAAGLATLVLDEGLAPGGQIWRAAEAVAGDPARREVLASSYRGAPAAIKAARAHATIMSGAEVVDVSAERDILWFDRAAGRLRETRARAILLATGAMERPVAFPGWTLPGVSGAGALQIAIKQGGLVPQGPVILAGQGPLLLLVAHQLRMLGAEVAATLDFGPAFPSRAALAALPGAARADAGLVASGVGLAVRRTLSGTAYRNVTALRAVGGSRLEAVEFTADGMVYRLPAARLGVHDGVIPATQLSRLLGLAHRWIDPQAAFAPRHDDEHGTSAEGVFVAGDGAGIEGAALAATRGGAAGRAICRALGVPPGPLPAAARVKGAAAAAARPLVDALYPPLSVASLADDETVLCRCESVTVGAVRQAVRLGATGPNRVKTATRCGMGPCQGRMCGNGLTRLLAEETGKPPDAVGALRIRPPLKPVLLADYARLADPEPAG